MRRYLLVARLTLLARFTRGREPVTDTLEKSPQPTLDTYHTCIYPYTSHVYPVTNPLLRRYRFFC